MKIFKKIVSMFLAFLLVFSSLPFQFMNLNGILQTYADGGPSTVTIEYDNFANTEGLQLNGDSIIVNNTIQFENENDGGEGKSAFTKDLLALGDNLFFSTNFSFKNIHPGDPRDDTKGGFTFTLQSVGNDVTASDFHDETIQPSLSIAFVTEYREAPSTSRITQPLQLASMAGFKIAAEAPIIFNQYLEPYIDGISIGRSEMLSNWHLNGDTDYQVWIGYKIVDKILHILFQGSMGRYEHFTYYWDPSEVFADTDLYAGFMGSLGDAGNTSEISNWYFKNDLSILDEAMVAADENWMTSWFDERGDYPYSESSLPIEGQYGSTISWISSNLEVIAGDGAVILPSLEEGEVDVTVKAVITKGSAVRRTEPFTITVRQSDWTKMNADYELLDWSQIKGENSDDDLHIIDSDLILPVSGKYGSTIQWGSDKPGVVSVDGIVNRPIYPSTDTPVTLTADISMGSYGESKTFDVTVKAMGMTDEDKRDADFLWLTADKIKGANDNLIYVTKNLSLMEKGHYGSTISWVSDNEAVIKSDGTVIRPLYNEDENFKEVVLTAHIRYGDSTLVIKEFTITVVNNVQTDAERIEADKLWLDWDKIKKDNNLIDNIIGDLELRDKGPNGSTITWTSNYTDVIATDGTVTRPLYTDEDKTVVLIATISINETTETKEFTLRVIKNLQTDIERVQADKLWLDEDKIENICNDLNHITGDLILPTIGANESTISWASSNMTIISIDGAVGRVTRPPYTKGDQIVRLTATIISGEAREIKDFTLTVIKFDQTDEEKLGADEAWLTEDKILNGNRSLTDVMEDLSLPNEGENGSTISWESDNIDVIIVKESTGIVIRPSYTIGDKDVVLTATISLGELSNITKTFTVTVIKLEQTEAEKDIVKLNNDYIWLINKLTSEQDLNNLIVNLNLPIVGQNGSTISWTTSNKEVIDVTIRPGVGIVNRPKYDLSAENVILTATIIKGLSSKEKEFNVRVLPRDYMFDNEVVESDFEWLTEELILNGNSSLDNVISNLYLPTKGVGYEPNPTKVSTIEWWISNPSVIFHIGDSGIIIRPSFNEGNRAVNITATLRSGPSFKQKTFKLLVKCPDATDKEAVSETKKWLKGYKTIPYNNTSNVVTGNLSWPKQGLFGSTVTWSSSNPDIISNEGMVTRPAHDKNHTKVNARATIRKGEMVEVLDFEYTVLRDPDMVPPVVVSTSLGDSNTDVSWDTSEFTISYDKNIVLNSDIKITLNGDMVGVSSIGNYLNIKPIVLPKPFKTFITGENKLVIPAGAVTNQNGNPSAAFELSFTMKEVPVKIIEVISSSPGDEDKDIDTNIREVTIQFNDDNIIKGTDFDKKIVLSTWDGDYKEIPTTNHLVAGKVTMQFKDPLPPGTVCGISIDRGAVWDESYNTNNSTYIQFKTQEVLIHQIESIYPARGEIGVSINPNIEIMFSKLYKPKSYDIKLTDALGNDCPLYAPYILDLQKTHIPQTMMIFKPQKYLQPNMVYTLSGPYGWFGDPDEGKEFSIQFTTGSGPKIIRTSPSTGDLNASRRGRIDIHFDTPVTKGPNFDDIVFNDIYGQSIKFNAEEEGGKVTLLANDELEALPYSIYIPYGAYKDSNGVPNTQNKITYNAKLEKTMGFESYYLDVPEVGFIGKTLKIGTHEDGQWWEDYLKSEGYGPISYEWRIDGELVSKHKYFYHVFYNSGGYVINLTVKDKYGFTYSGEKNIGVKALGDIEMSLKRNQETRFVGSNLYDGDFTLNCELRLESEGQFIADEKIEARLYRDGVLQPLGQHANGAVYITSTFEEGAYRYLYKADRGDFGTYEFEFTYGDQVIRQTFMVFAEKPNKTDVFRFRLYERIGGDYYEDLNYVYVNLNGERIKANKEMYTYDGSTYPVYAIKKPLQTNVYYHFNVENWWGNYGENADKKPFYIGKDTNNPTILTGGRGGLGRDMRITNLKFNSDESDLRTVYLSYFEGFSTKMVIDVEGDWAGTDTGYYEIKTSNIASNLNLISPYNNRREIQEIIVQPGIQLKADPSDHYLIRMVSAQGFKSPWYVQSSSLQIDVLPLPSIMGKKLDISIKDREYVVAWPTVFDGPIGGAIGFLEGIPVVSGGSFGMGGAMPKFEGEMYRYGNELNLSFKAQGGYGSSTSTSQATKYKKLKKVTVVGVDFHIELDGDITLVSDRITGEWGIAYFRISLGGDIRKYWDKGYKFLGVGFTAGIGLGAGVYGTLIVEEGEKYSGIIKIIPHADLHVDGSFVVANVKGSLTAKIPAEIHFPTGYIGVGFEVDAYIYAKALLWGKVIYDKRLVNLQWNNGNQKVGARSLDMLMEEALIYEDSGMQLMSRDYLNRGSNWLGGDTRSGELQDSNNLQRFSLMTTEEETNISIVDILENIFPEADLELGTNQGEQWLVWIDDNPSRDDMNRTQLRYSVFKDGNWSNSEWIYDDGTADFSPAIAPVGNGILMAWHNIGGKLTGEEGLDEALKSSEIYVTEGIYTRDGEEPKTIRLTDDEKIDHSPRIATNGEKALLVWTKSEELGYGLEDEEDLTSSSKGQLYFSTWNKDIWNAPEAIGTEPSTILDSSLTMNGEEGLLLYTVDMDDKISTGEDREIYGRLYDGKSWGEAIKLTHNDWSDSAPKAVSIEGEWFITWLEDGKILYKIGLNGETKAEEMLENVQGNYQITAKGGNRPLIALIYTQPGEDKALNLYSSFYDFDYGKWSDKVDLVIDNSYTGKISSDFDQEGRLNVAFTQAEIITELELETIDDIEEILETEVVTDKVDLKLLTYTPVHDVTILEDSIYLSREIPIPNAVTAVYSRLVNNGDFAEDITVLLYDGNPTAGGVNIAETTVLSLPGRTSKEIQIDWLVGAEERDQYDLYLVAEISDKVQGRSFSNNTFDLYANTNKAVSMGVYTSDIAITDLTCENIAADDYFIKLTISNNGFNDLEGATLWLEDDITGEVLQTTSLARLGIGEQTTLTYMISSRVEKDLRARVSLPEGVNESNTENNIEYFTLEPALFMLKSLNIGPGEEQVDPATDIIIEFNMNIGQGSGFENIKLMDDDLNVLDINKVIEANILTIKPENSLKYGSRYTLAIPVDALGDSYGHKLNREFNMNFTTMTTNPEIISAYPGKGMKNTEIDTAIKFRFNQNIIKGNEFAKLSLYEHGDESETRQIPISASIVGESLTINYKGNLNKDTTYTLEIPRGAVKNEIGEIQGRDYKLVFTTGKGEKKDKEDIIDKEDQEDQGGQPPSNAYKASINFGDTKRAIDIFTQGGKALVKLDAPASELFKGKQNIILNIPAVPGVDSYMLEMPAEALGGGQSSLTINSVLGSLDIPSSMLSMMKDIQGKTICITIGAVDSSKLPTSMKVAIGNRPVIQLTMALNGEKIKWENQDAPVKVSIPYKPEGEELENPESIIIWYIDADDNIIIIPNGYYNDQTYSVDFNTTHFSNFAVAYNKVDFKDVKDDAWYHKAVNFIAAREITTGTGNNNFNPNNKLTRGQFITMMMRAYSIEPNSNAKENFLDAGDTWYTGYLARAKELGISKGVGDNKFAPDKEITRQEMFTLLYNTLNAIKQLPKAKQSKRLSDFIDETEIASWAIEGMSLLVEAGTINGSGGKLKPLNKTTRAEMAQILYNLMSK